MLKKILNFIDGVFEEKEQPTLGTLYKIKGEIILLYKKN